MFRVFTQARPSPYVLPSGSILARHRHGPREATCGGTKGHEPRRSAGLCSLEAQFHLHGDNRGSHVGYSPSYGTLLVIVFWGTKMGPQF